MKYPTRNGLIIPPYELGFTCPEVYTKGKTNNHHGYYYKEAYVHSSISEIFANLVQNVYIMDMREHVKLHNTYDPPVKPKEELMIDVIEEVLAVTGVIQHVSYTNTHKIHEVTTDRWNIIKKFSSCRNLR